MKFLMNKKRSRRIRKKLKKVNSERFRLTVNRSSRNISAQIIDDVNNKNLKLINYIKKNSYWKSYSINHLIDELKDNRKNKISDSFNKIKKKYIDLSNKYQSSKKKNSIPLK